MLKSLRIKNYAILEHQEILFPAGLNIITGETGAGKSIILGALNLILGVRADVTVLYDKNKKCIVEAVFDIDEHELADFFALHDLDSGHELIIRREIAANGKSRAFVNDTPVLLTQLRELSGLILDLHQQFAVLELQETPYQVKTLDAYAELNSIAKSYSTGYQQLQLKKNELKVLKEKEQQALREKDYLEFQMKEFQSLQLAADELREVESQMHRLRHAKEIKESLQTGFHKLEEKEESLIDQLQEIAREIDEFSGFDSKLAEHCDRIELVIVELRDIAAGFQEINEELELDPAALEDLEKQMNVFNRLQLKHSVGSPEELLSVKAEIEEKLSSFESLGEHITNLEKEIKNQTDQLWDFARELSKARKAKSTGLSAAVNDLLKGLKMENASLRIDISEEKELGKYGADSISFLFAPNKGSGFHRLKKVASGGELSRLSLCIKAVVAQKMDMPTLVFDEIDQGVSGEVAKRMGEILSDLSGFHQVIMITHSPQIAGKARTHFHVIKRSADKKTIAEISELHSEARVQEIAKMLSGDPPTPAALENARELITA